MFIPALLLALQTAQAPAPAPVPCSRDATVLHQIPPDYPEAARELGLGQRSVGIRVYISPQGTIAALRVLNSSGNNFLDQAALGTAAQSTFSPRVKNCKATFGSAFSK
jgi:TonB family protein